MNVEDMVTTHRKQVVDQGGAAAKRRKETAPTKPPAAERDQKIEPQSECLRLQFTPLNMPPGKILMEIRNNPEIQ